MISVKGALPSVRLVSSHACTSPNVLVDANLCLWY